MDTLSLKEMGKFLWEGREKGLPPLLSQFSKTKPRTTRIYSLWDSSEISLKHGPSSDQSFTVKNPYFLSKW